MNSISKCLLILLVALGFAFPVAAQDLSDNATCLECHADAERAPPADPNIPQVHNPAGGFFAEAHEMWTCVDCHTDIEEIPHPEGVGDMTVDCTNCHDATPQK